MSFYLICISNKFVLNFRSNREAASKLMVFSFHSLPQAHAKLLYRRPLSHLSGCNRISNNHNSNGHIMYGERKKYETRKKIKQIEQKVLSNVWIDLQFRGEKTTSTMKAAAFNVVELSNVCIGRHLLFRTKLKNIAVGLLFFFSFRCCEIAMVNALHWSECFEWFIEFR